jgi:predicted esterase
MTTDAQQHSKVSPRGGRDRIHLDTYRNPEAKVKVILVHGLGTNGRQMMTILGAPLARRDYDNREQLVRDTGSRNLSRTIASASALMAKLQLRKASIAW